MKHSFALLTDLLLAPLATPHIDRLAPEELKKSQIAYLPGEGEQKLHVLYKRRRRKICI